MLPVYINWWARETPTSPPVAGGFLRIDTIAEGIEFVLQCHRRGLQWKVF